ncbi:MAG: hypothetical protein NT061_03090 [Spirochaetes bacterium]|nr:hypothetical protein [Spirochaetota bacterium]
MKLNKKSPKDEMERIVMNKNMKRAIPAALALALALMFPRPASAINYYFNNFYPNVPTATYDWTSNQQLITDIGYASASGKGTYGFVFWDFSPATGARFFSNGSYTIPYSIKKYVYGYVGNELYAYSPGVTKDHVLSNTFYGPFTNTPLYFVIIPTAGLIMPAGSYTTSITVGYYKGTQYGTSISNARSTGATYSQAINLIVPVICDLSIMPSTSSTFDSNTYNQTLNFGDMIEGESMSVNAILRTNAGSWSLAVASTNGGYMKNSATGTTVHYTFNYNGTVTALTTISTIIETGGWTDTSSGYATRHLTFTLGDTFNTPGTYSDNLTFTLTAN